MSVKNLKETAVFATQFQRALQGVVNILKNTCLLAITIGLLTTANYQLLHAQTLITLQAATDTALKNNLSVRNEWLRTTYQKQLVQTSKNISPTNIFAEVGQINSFYVDTRLNAAQTISFPKVYNSQKSLLTEEWKSSELNVNVKKTSLKLQVAQVYYNLLYLQEKKKLLQKTDSMFTEFLNRATLRFNKGESNILEKTTAENQRGQITLQLEQLQHDMDLVHLQFQLLLNTENVFIPDEREFKTYFTAEADTFLGAHPAMQFLKQQQYIAAAATQVEKSKLLPTITLGYSIQSIKGTGANNKTYNNTPQFQSVQIGLGIPIFNHGQKARINAAKTNEKIVANDYKVNFKNFEVAYKTALGQLKKYTETIRFFETTGLRNADVITTTANKQFLNGDINYLEFVLLVNQAIATKSEYIEAVNNWNKAVIEIRSFSTK